jgi:hypothetical protein
MKYLQRNWILIVLFTLGILIPLIAIYLYQHDGSVNWKIEVAKSLMALAMSAIIGAFIKLAFDEKSKRDLQQKKVMEFRGELLNRLRSVFDKVDSSRLLIEAHKSARTYGEQIRANIIPSISSLYDIKRSLVDAKKMADKNSLAYLRISLHYMIAYLKVLSEEYKHDYLEISNLQYFQEAAKEKQKEQFKQQFERDKEASFSSLPKPPDVAWQRIIASKYISDFLSDKFDAQYYKCFIDPYEYCKKILKGTSPADQTPSWLNIEYLKTLDDIDNKRTAGAIRESDNLVSKIMKEVLGFSEVQSKNP